MIGGILGFVVFAIMIPFSSTRRETSRGPWPGVCCGGELTVVRWIKAAQR